MSAYSYIRLSKTKPKLSNLKQVFMNLTTFVKSELPNIKLKNMKNKQIFSFGNLNSLKLMVVILLLTLPLASFSQEFKLMQSDQYLKGLKSASENKTHDWVLSLLKDNHPSIHLYNGESKVYGKGLPVCLFTDAKSVSAVRSLQNVGAVEMVTITVNSRAELSQSLSSDIFKNLDGIRYIHIVVHFDIRGQELSNFIKTEKDSPFIVFYTVEKPT